MKNLRIGFVAAEAEPGSDVERHLMPTVGNTVAH